MAGEEVSLSCNTQEIQSKYFHPLQDFLSDNKSGVCESDISYTKVIVYDGTININDMRPIE